MWIYRCRDKYVKISNIFKFKLYSFKIIYRKYKCPLFDRGSRRNWLRFSQKYGQELSSGKCIATMIMYH